MDIASDSPDILNRTAFEEDPYDEADLEIDQEFKRYQILWTLQMVLMAVKILVCLITVAAVLFLVITMIRFKRLRTRLNMFILHMNVLAIFFFLVVPILMIITGFIMPFVHMYLLEVQNVILMLYIAFGLFMSIDWTLSCHKSNWIDFYQQRYQYYLNGIYIVYIIFFIVMITNMSHALVLIDFFLVYYIVCCIILTALNIKRRFTKLRPEHLKTAYVMTISNITIYSFIPTLVFYWSMMYLIRHNLASDIIMILVEAVMVIITLGHPIAVVYYLGRSNKYFKMAYNKSFKRSIRSYGDDDLDEVSEDENPDANKVVNYSNEDGLDENKQVLII